MMKSRDFWNSRCFCKEMVHIRSSSDVGVNVISVDIVELVECVLRLRFRLAGRLRNERRRYCICVEESCVYSYVNPPMIPPRMGPTQ